MKLLLFTLLFLPSFATQACEVTLTWTPPTQNTDGSQLTNLAKYVIAYGPSKVPTRWTGVKAPANSKTLKFPSQAGAYYFVIRAVNSADIKSGPSNQVSKLCTYAAQPNPPALK